VFDTQCTHEVDLPKIDGGVGGKVGFGGGVGTFSNTYLPITQSNKYTYLTEKS